MQKCEAADQSKTDQKYHVYECDSELNKPKNKEHPPTLHTKLNLIVFFVKTNSFLVRPYTKDWVYFGVFSSHYCGQTNASVSMSVLNTALECREFGSKRHFCLAANTPRNMQHVFLPIRSISYCSHLLFLGGGSTQRHATFDEDIALRKILYYRRTGKFLKPKRYLSFKFNLKNKLLKYK